MAVTFDAAGAGYFSGGATGSWAHTIAAGANCCMVGLSCGAVTPTVKVGTTSMTQVGATQSPDGTGRYQIFALLNPPTGAQTIFVTAASNFTNGDSVSYNNVLSIGSLQTSTGSGTAASQAVSSAVGRMVFQMFGSNANGTTSAYSQTQRYFHQDPGTNYPVTIGDAPGAATVNFAATLPVSGTWNGMAVDLTPVVVSSFFPFF
jgi:hypothetical protein